MKNFKTLHKKDIFPLLILFLIVIGFFLPILLQPNKLISNAYPPGLETDISLRHWGDMVFLASNLKVGRLPLWDPMTALGRPLAGDTAVLFAYPLNLIFLILKPPLAFTVLTAIHIYIAGFFMYLLLRLGFAQSRNAALFGALAFAFAPKSIAHLTTGHIGVIWGLSWMPAVILGILLSLNGRSYIYAALAGLAHALPISNHIQIPYYTGFLIGCYWIWHSVKTITNKDLSNQEKKQKISRGVKTIIIWILFFFLFAAIVLLPLIEILPYNSRQDFSIQSANYLALPPIFLTSIIMPTQFLFSELVMYVGILPLIFAIFGLIYSKNSNKWFFAIFIIFALFYSIGTATPLFEAAFNLIPGFNLLRIPTRLWFMGGMAISLLASFGFDHLETQNVFLSLSKIKSKIILMLAILILGGVGIVGLGLSLNTEPKPTFQIYQVVTLVSTLLAFILWQNKKIFTPAFQSGLLIFLSLELILIAAGYIKLIEPQQAFLTPTPAFEFIADQPGVFRTYSPDSDFPYALAVEHGTEYLEGFLAFQIFHSAEKIGQAAQCPRNTYNTFIPACEELHIPEDPHALGKLNVKYFLTKESISHAGYQLVLNTSTQKVYEILDWEPRVNLQNGGKANIVERFPGDYLISVKVENNTTLIIKESWLPGWKAELNGLPAEVSIVDDVFIGVPVEKGNHQVHVYYFPDPWIWGVRVSISAFLILLIWGIVEIRKNRKGL